MTHECMNEDGQMVTVERDSAWGIYHDDGRSPTLQRLKVMDAADAAQEEAEWLRCREDMRDVRVVAVCLGETPTMGIWKVCRGRKAIEPNRDPVSSGAVQVGKPPAGGES